MPVMELSGPLPDQQSGTEGRVGTVAALWRLPRLLREQGWKKKNPDVRRGTKWFIIWGILGSCVKETQELKLQTECLKKNPQMSHSSSDFSLRMWWHCRGGKYLLANSDPRRRRGGGGVGAWGGGLDCFTCSSLLLLFPHATYSGEVRGEWSSRNPTSSPKALLPTSDTLPLCTHTHTSAHNKRGMSRRTPAALHHRLKQMALHRETLREQLYVCGSRRCLLRGCCGGCLLVCLAPTHFVYRETDAFLHKALYNSAPSCPIRGLLLHCVSEEVMVRVRQPTDRYQILKCVFP